MSKLYEARRRAGMTQQQAADAWSAATEKPRLAKTIGYYEAWPAKTGRKPSWSTLLELAGVYRCGVSDLVDGEDQPVPHEAVLAVIRHDGHVLLARRADTMMWTLPAATRKPGADPERTLVREVAAETGISVTVGRELGSRVHPVTRAFCRYFVCDYLAGEPVNGDPEENVSVAWVPLARLRDFIPANLFAPVADYLEGPARV